MSELTVSDSGGHAALAAARPGASGRPIGKWLAGLFSLALVGAVLSPLHENWRRRPHDDFPLSYYPMFSYKRADIQRVSYVAGVDARGRREPIRYSVIGSGGMNQVRRQIERRVERGQAGDLCQAVAARVARSRSRSLSNVVSVQVITGTFSMSQYFTGDRSPRAEHVHTACQVRRS